MSTVTDAPVRPAGDALGTGRRKTAVARVRIRAGSGKITVNDRPFDEYFLTPAERGNVLVCLEKTGVLHNVDVDIRCDGGGVIGQSGACKMGIARALKLYDATLEPILREHSLLTRDSRMKERKHYGLRGARRGTQFSKR